MWEFALNVSGRLQSIIGLNSEESLLGTAPITLTMMGCEFDVPKWPNERPPHSCSSICSLVPGLSADLLFLVKVGKTVVSQHEIQNLRLFNSCVKNRKYKAPSLRTSSPFSKGA